MLFQFGFRRAFLVQFFLRMSLSNLVSYGFFRATFFNHMKKFEDIRCVSHLLTPFRQSLRYRKNILAPVIMDNIFLNINNEPQFHLQLTSVHHLHCFDAHLTTIPFVVYSPFLKMLMQIFSIADYEVSRGATLYCLVSKYTNAQKKYFTYHAEA